MQINLYKCTFFRRRILHYEERQSIGGALAAVTAFSMTACGGGQAGGTTQAAAAGTQAAVENTANPNAETTLSIGYTTAANADDPYHFTATKFKEIVEEIRG